MTRELGFEGAKELGKGGGSGGNKRKCPGVEENWPQISKEACRTAVSREEHGREAGQEEDIAWDRRHMEFCPLRSPWPLGVCPSLPGLGLGQYDSPHS